jgi:hypothetical protein
MSLNTGHLAATYANSAASLTTLLAAVKSSETCLSSRVVSHYLTFKKHPHFSNNGSTSGQFFEMVFTEALSVVGVSLSRQWIHVKHGETNVEVDVFVVGAKRPIIILLKSSLRERWKQEDRDALAIRHNEKGCASALYQQLDIGKFDSAYPPIIWAITWRERETVSPDAACKFAKKIGKKCAGIDTDRCVSVFDKERMDFLVTECKEEQ